MDTKTEEECSELIEYEAHINKFMPLLKKLQMSATNTKNMKVSEVTLYSKINILNIFSSVLPNP